MPRGYEKILPFLTGYGGRYSVKNVFKSYVEFLFYYVIITTALKKNFENRHAFAADCFKTENTFLISFLKFSYTLKNKRWLGRKTLNLQTPK